MNGIGWLLGAWLGLWIRLARWLLRMAARYPYVTAWAASAALTLASVGYVVWDTATGWLLLAVLAETAKSPAVKARRRSWRDRRRATYRRWYRHARREVESYIVPVIQAKYPEHAERIHGAVKVARDAGVPGLWRGLRTTAPR
jgi:hypothetical protein